MAHSYVSLLARRAAVEEEKIDRAAAARPLRDWTFDAATQRWTKQGVLYVVHVCPPSSTRKRGDALDPPFEVRDPNGVKMGGSTHLARAQQLADVLGEPLPKRNRQTT